MATTVDKVADLKTRAAALRRDLASTAGLLPGPVDPHLRGGQFATLNLVAALDDFLGTTPKLEGA